MLDGRPLTGLESDKVRALLSYLAMHAGRPQRREILTGLLWPDSPETSARASLRNALANLRHAIGDHHSTTPFLTISRQSNNYEESADNWLDIADFNHALQNSIAS